MSAQQAGPYNWMINGSRVGPADANSAAAVRNVNVASANPWYLGPHNYPAAVSQQLANPAYFQMIQPGQLQYTQALQQHQQQQQQQQQQQHQQQQQQAANRGPQGGPPMMSAFHPQMRQIAMQATAPAGQRAALAPVSGPNPQQGFVSQPQGQARAMQGVSIDTVRLCLEFFCF